MLVLNGVYRPYRKNHPLTTASFGWGNGVFRLAFTLFFVLGSLSLSALNVEASGVISHGGVPLQGILVKANAPGVQDSAYTDVNGNYSITLNTPANSGVLEVVMKDCQQSDQKQSFNFTTSSTQFTADYTTYCPQNTLNVSGLLSHLGQGKPNELIWFSVDGFTSVLDSVSTDAGGNFNHTLNMTGHPQGTLTVRFVDCEKNNLDKDVSFLLGESLQFDLNYCKDDTLVIFGRITTGGQMLNGQRARVETYFYNPSTQFFSLTEIDTTLTDGTYKVNLKKEGEYLIKALPLDNLNQSAAGYGGSLLTWETSTVIEVKEDQPANHVVDLAEFPVHSGTGTITGTTYTSMVNSSGEILPHAPLLLRKSSDKTLVSYTQSDEFGKFEFSQLPDGEYEVYLDVPGLPTEAPTIQINQSTPDQTTEPIRVSRKGVTFGDYLGTQEKVTKPGTEVYPNPFENKLNIRNLEVNSTISLLDLTGKVVMQETTQSLQINWDTQELLPGLYVLKIESSLGEDTAMRVVKSR
ncbi:T9SS type A sorting domain-containing protein [bacterium SCSIO 12741]|nr:T9SS type A sorting domain-containing protein [bacterium SCSIO 12741]